MEKTAENISRWKILASATLPSAAIILATVYLIVRTILFIISPNPWYEKIVGLFLLLAEIFMLIHGIGYFVEIAHVYSRQKSLTARHDTSLQCDTFPPVAVIVSSYKEPLNVIEETVICLYNLKYKNKQIYFLDDTRYDLPDTNQEEMKTYRAAVDDMCRRLGVDLFRRKWRGAKAGMINDFLDFLTGKNNDGFELKTFSKQEKKETPKYIVVFDADQNPVPSFLEPLVGMMEKEPRLAFIQTPQYYSNFETNRIARASGLQQAVFYEYICEGKSINDAMFCCGTNVIFRREALVDVGGFDERSVTEDFATSLKFHLKGWHSAYVNRIMAFGMGPEDLGGYFKQQFRWALGTVGMIRSLARNFIEDPGSLTKVRWWEYFLSTTYYFIGLVFLILVLCPIIYLLFDVPSYFANPLLYAVFFFPYFVMSMTVFLWALRERNYRPRELFSGQLLIAISFPVYIKAAILGLAGVKGKFGVTTKSGASSLPLKDLWPQISLITLNIIAGTWGVNRMIYEREVFWAILVNIFWCTYHALVLSSVFYFNSPQEEKARAPDMAPVQSNR